jgi:hypothetical protein
MCTNRRPNRGRVFSLQFLSVAKSKGNQSNGKTAQLTIAIILKIVETTADFDASDHGVYINHILRFQHFD